MERVLRSGKNLEPVRKFFEERRNTSLAGVVNAMKSFDESSTREIATGDFVYTSMNYLGAKRLYKQVQDRIASHQK